MENIHLIRPFLLLLAIVFVAYFINKNIGSENEGSRNISSNLEPSLIVNPALYNLGVLESAYRRATTQESGKKRYSENIFFIAAQGFGANFSRPDVMSLRDDARNGSKYNASPPSIGGYQLKEISGLLDVNDTFVQIVDHHTLSPSFRPYLISISVDKVQITKSKLTRAEIQSKVKKLRCGLDLREWHVNYENCSSYYPKAPKTTELGNLPFDISLAYELYTGLFGELINIQGSSLIHFALSGPIASIPMNVLVTVPGENFSDTKWFVEKYDHTVSTSVEGFVNLKTRKKNPASTRKNMSFLGIGNPSIDGDMDNPFYSSQFKKASRMARAFTSCTTGELLGFGNIGKFIPAFERYADIEIDKDGLVNARSIHKMAPLPESAFEICSVSENFKTLEKKMMLSKYASERKLKDMSSNGLLEQYRVIHIASHAILDRNNDLNKTGIVLTPQRKGNRLDDGFLSAVEISSLRLNADWVILSACNTGTIAEDSGEEISGLADAFFNANSRSILVSHWTVASNAAMEIVTKTMSNYITKLDSKSSALRKAILTVKGDYGEEAHPSYWGAFSLLER